MKITKSRQIYLKNQSEASGEVIALHIGARLKTIAVYYNNSEPSQRVKTSDLHLCPIIGGKWLNDTFKKTGHFLSNTIKTWKTALGLIGADPTS